MGHRNSLGLTVQPDTGAIWESENGPNGGDEVNLLQAGKNYGWPIVSYGRFYLGPRVSVKAWQEGMEDPMVFWVPAIATSGLSFYTGDRFPQWKGNLFAGGMRQGEVPRSGHLERIDFNEKWEELHRESFLRELQQRIRDVRQGPDGLLYVLTAENDGALLGSNRAQRSSRRPGKPDELRRLKSDVWSLRKERHSTQRPQRPPRSPMTPLRSLRVLRQPSSLPQRRTLERGADFDA